MKCIVCGKEFEQRMFADDICSQECFKEYFWTQVLDKSAIVIDGYCYHAGNSNSTFKGFGGREFTILFNDGIRMTTNNLWCNGKIPEKLLIPDNAKFVNDIS